MIASLWIVGGILSLFVCFCGQLAAGSAPSPVWKILHDGWRPALVCTGTVLLSAVFASAAHSVSRPRHHSGPYTSVQNTLVVRATTTVAHNALHRWAAENGYTDGPSCRWSLQTVPKGELVGRVDLSNVWKDSSVDRWLSKSSGSKLPSPDLSFQIIGSEKPVQSEVMISAGLVEIDSQDQKQRQGIVKGLSDAVSKASESDLLKPVEIPPVKQTETSSEWPGLCSVLAAVLLWIFVRALTI